MTRKGITGFDGTLLRAQRERRGQTQRDVAEQFLRATRPGWPGTDVTRAAADLHTAQNQISAFETGQAPPGLAHAFTLAQILKADVLAFLDPATPYTLETLRVRRGLRQDDVIARGLPVTRAYYGRVERGAARLAPPAWQILAGILGVTMVDLDTAYARAATVGDIAAGTPSS